MTSPRLAGLSADALVEKASTDLEIALADTLSDTANLLSAYESIGDTDDIVTALELLRKLSLFIEIKPMDEVVALSAYIDEALKPLNF